MNETSQYVTKEKEFFTPEKSTPVVITRFFNATLEKVWDAWSDPAMMKEWWGPETYSCPEAEIDFRVGGTSLLAMRDPQGEVVWSGGVYKEIVPYKKIVTTDHFADPSGNPVSARDVGMPGDWPMDCVITIEFSDANEEQVKIMIKHEGIPKAMHDDCTEGWNSSIDKLQRLVETH